MEYQGTILGRTDLQPDRDDILSGNYTPGEELKEATLGKQLGVSRTPGAGGPGGSWIWKVWWRLHRTVVPK